MGRRQLNNKRAMNTKHRIFQDSDIMLTDKDLRLEKNRKRNKRERSASYDFLGTNVDMDEQRRKKIEARKRNLIQQYKLNRGNWTKDTPRVLKELTKGRESEKEQKVSKAKPKKEKAVGFKMDAKEKPRKSYSPEIKDPAWVMAEDYEDPRLTQMKHEMKMHAELRKEIRNKSPLHGDSTYEHDKKVRALRKSMNVSQRSISGLKQEQSSRKVGHKRKGDFGKVHFAKSAFSNRVSQEREEMEPKQPSPPKRAVSPLKLKYDYQGSFRIGFEKKLVNAEER